MILPQKYPNTIMKSILQVLECACVYGFSPREFYHTLFAQSVHDSISRLDLNNTSFSLSLCADGICADHEMSYPSAYSLTNVTTLSCHKP